MGYALARDIVDRQDDECKKLRTAKVVYKWLPEGKSGKYTSNFALW